MSEIRSKYDDEFKKNAVKLSYASPKSVKQVAEDLGISENLGERSTPPTETKRAIRRWKKK